MHSSTLNRPCIKTIWAVACVGRRFELTSLLWLRNRLMTQVGWGQVALEEDGKQQDVDKHRQAGRKKENHAENIGEGRGGGMSERRAENDRWTQDRPVGYHSYTQTDYSFQCTMHIHDTEVGLIMWRVCACGVCAAFALGIYLCPAGSVAPYGQQCRFPKTHTLRHKDIGSHKTTDMCAWQNKTWCRERRGRKRESSVGKIEPSAHPGLLRFTIIITQQATTVPWQAIQYIGLQSN